jgi:hypothetical protein
MKQTAVEWLAEQYKLIDMLTTAQIEKAKEMEKQHIVDAFDDGYDLNNSLVNYNGEQYYNDTFKK